VLKVDILQLFLFCISIFEKKILDIALTTERRNNPR